MCNCNNVNVDSIPPEIFWGQSVWDPQHPSSSRLSKKLFDFVERHDWPPDNGLQSSDSDGSFVNHVIDDLDLEEYADTD